jgi:hypothetical protein
VDFYFPKEDAPRATDDELMALVQEAMREVAARPETCAIAVATEIARDGQRFMAVQAETRQEAVVLHFPLRRRLWWRVLGESEQVEGLLAQRLFAGEPHGEAG